MCSPRPLLQGDPEASLELLAALGLPLDQLRHPDRVQRVDHDLRVTEPLRELQTARARGDRLLEVVVVERDHGKVRVRRCELASRRGRLEQRNGQTASCLALGGHGAAALDGRQLAKRVPLA
jgi:hypothetical protein